MDQPTDPLARQLALTALTTEHFNLQTARMGTIAEANGRSTLYLGTLSSATIAIAFVGQASELGDAFYLFALSLLPPVFLLGVFSFLRLVQTSIEDMVYAAGAFRIRQYFLGLDPAAVPFFPPTDPQGMTKLERMGVVATGPLQLLLTAASMVACINAIIGGVSAALALRSLLEASVPVAAVTGAVVALGLAGLCFGYQVRRFRRAATVVPELYEGQSPGMPGWVEPAESREP
jgi:predicted small integral membrane protein